MRLCSQPISHNHFSTSPVTATWWLPGFSTESKRTRLPADPSLAFLMPLGIQADDQHGPEEPENGSRSKKFTAHSLSRTFTSPRQSPSSGTQGQTASEGTGQGFSESPSELRVQLTSAVPSQLTSVDHTWNCCSKMYV